jgi:membrane protease YdiL (CAAX protease family)
MRILGPWLVYLCVVVVGGALLAPWAYRALQPAAERLPSLRPLAEQPFHRYVNRSLLGLALVGLWPLLRRRKFMSWRELGWAGEAHPGALAARGLALGFAGLGLAGGLAVAAGARDWRSDLALGEVVRGVVLAAGSAVAVAVIEETLFRGLLQGTLRRVWRAGAAVAASSAVYAVAHFLNRVRWDAPVDWASGFGVLARMLAGFGEWAQVMPGFLHLGLAGVLLGVAFERSGSLYFSAGLHAGWVFALKLYHATTQATAAGPTALWGSSKLTDGWVALPALAVTAVLLPWALRRPPARPTA